MELGEHPDSKKPFSDYEEGAIAALMIDHPEFFDTISDVITPHLFKQYEVQLIIMAILNYYEKYNCYPSRGMLRTRITKELSVDDEHIDDILGIVDRESNPKDIPALKESLLDWAREAIYSELYNHETIDRYKAGDWSTLNEIVERAVRIQDTKYAGLNLFDDIEALFDVARSEKFTTGFSQLDSYLNDGGPSRKQTVTWMAPTGVGKSIMLVNNAIANLLDDRKVLFITLELSALDTMIRAIGVITGQPIRDRVARRDSILEAIRKYKRSCRGDIYFHEYAPDEINVNHINNLIDYYKRVKGWQPDVIIVDYLELMRGRWDSDNKDDYTRQKSISTQLRGLAKTANVVLFTATQTNRSGNNSDGMIGVDKIAESYGKTMPMDYLISINQSAEQKNDSGDGKGSATLYIAKNRSGPSLVSVPVKINYHTMAVKEIS